MKATPGITNFTAGEVSPRLDGRVDLSRYFNALKTLYNMIVYPHGGATRRAGTKLIAEVKNSASPVRLIPFEFSDDQSYMIESGDGYMRFYMDQGNIVSGGAPYEIATTINAASLPAIYYAQNADTMFMTHQQMQPQELTRTGHTAWTLGAVDFSGSSINPFDGPLNWPAIVNFYEQRTAWAATRNGPQTIYLSASGDPRNMGSGPLDSDALQFEIAAENVNRIKWMAPLKVLLFGTIGGEWRISSDTITEPLTATNVYARRESNYGSGSARPVVIGNSVLYMQKHDRLLRELKYSFETDGWISPELTLFAEHLTGARNGATVCEMAYAGDPHSIVWAVRQDGTLLGLTYNRAQEIMAWHRHETDGVVESVAVIPGYLSGRDEVWLVVKRTINGSVKRFIEVMEDTEWTDAQDAWYVDCGLKYDGNGATTISGLDHLNGVSVAILADGYVVPQQTVVAGEIVLTNAASKVIAGLPFTSRLQTMRIEAGAVQGTAQTKKKRISEIALRLFESGEGFEVGPASDIMELGTLRQDTDAMDTAVPLFTGDVIMHPPADWETDGHIWIEQTMPLPLTVTMIVPRVNVSEYA